MPLKTLAAPKMVMHNGKAPKRSAALDFNRAERQAEGRSGRNSGASSASTIANGTVKLGGSKVKIWVEINSAMKNPKYLHMCTTLERQ